MIAAALLCALAVAAAPATTAATTEATTAKSREADGAADADDVGPKRVVGLLPLVADGTVTSKQAKGVTVQLRTAAEVLVGEGRVRLLPATRDDDNAVRRCGPGEDGFDGCVDDLAKARGADRLATGVVASSADGLVLTVHVRPGDGTSFTAILRGDDDDDDRLDRLARELFAPETLRGTLRIEGQPNDEVVIDGRRRGTLQPDDDGGRSASFVVDKLREGEHQLTVTRPLSKNGTAYDPFSRAVAVRHRETTTVKVTLLPKATTGALAEDAPVEAGAVNVGAIAVVGAGVVVGAAGVVCGVLSSLDAADVEERAAQQQLVFPRDKALVDRGAALAVAANVSYGVGVVLIGAGAAWLALTLPAPPAEGSAPAAPENP